MENYSDKIILEGYLNKDRIILEYVYKKFFDEIKIYIKNNCGNEEDAQDVFQDANIIVYSNIKNKTIKIKSSFKYYLFSVCMYLWKMELRKRSTGLKTLSFKDEYYNLEEDIGDICEKVNRFKLYQKQFKNLSVDCQTVLQLYIDKIPMKDIKSIMGYKSEGYTKKRKYHCKEVLMKKIKNAIKQNEKLMNCKF